ncbi:glycosyltransferase family 2 protein [Microbulbifer agarilyticus]
MTSSVVTLAGVITFHPDLPTLKSLLSRLYEDECEVVVVDNGSDNISEIRTLCQESDHCELIVNQENRGISGAGNQIFRLAVDRQHEFVVLFDQDSIPQQNYCSDLNTIFQQYRERRVAAISGRQFCRFTQRHQPFIRFSRWRVHKYSSFEGVDVIDAHFLITSGALVSVSCLKDIGGLEDELFIDNVDVEWCFRALAKGYRLLGVATSQFSHAIGEGRSLCLGVPIVKKHSSSRTYYVWRNVLSLLVRDYVPIVWKINAFIRMLLKLVFLIFTSSERFKHLSATLRGVRERLPRKTLDSAKSDVNSRGTSA